MVSFPILLSMMFSAKNVRIYALGVVISILSARAEQPAYTNHAGYAVSGYVVALGEKKATFSNDVEQVTLPLSIFPEAEKRRIAADYVLAYPEAGASMLRVPDDVRRSVKANAKAQQRSRLRADKGLCTKEESDEFCEKSSAALTSFLDGKVRSGVITASESRALRASASSQNNPQNNQRKGNNESGNR